jgi:hypothetical protein
MRSPPVLFISYTRDFSQPQYKHVCSQRFKFSKRSSNNPYNVRTIQRELAIPNSRTVTLSQFSILSMSAYEPPPQWQSGWRDSSLSSSSYCASIPTVTSVVQQTGVENRPLRSHWQFQFYVFQNVRGPKTEKRMECGNDIQHHLALPYQRGGCVTSLKNSKICLINTAYTLI